jgi:divalent metal cation (Fe/Co/Zn/Cd) transporter
MATLTTTRGQHIQRGIRLEYLTIAWNVIEGVVAIASGAIAGSIALVGFGIDSFIETSSGGILLWRLKAEHSGEDAEGVERKALRMVGIGFVLLAAYIAFDAVKTLTRRESPERSIAGIVIAVLSLLIMPWLARQKRKAAADLKSNALKADSRQTSLCAYLSVILLGGLLLNALLGWWWADPVAALAMVPIVINEGREALRGKACSDCHS